MSLKYTFQIGRVSLKAPQMNGPSRAAAAGTPMHLPVHIQGCIVPPGDISRWSDSASSAPPHPTTAGPGDNLWAVHSLNSWCHNISKLFSPN